jgi:hypothetical protein
MYDWKESSFTFVVVPFRFLSFSFLLRTALPLADHLIQKSESAAGVIQKHFREGLTTNRRQHFVQLAHELKQRRRNQGLETDDSDDSESSDEEDEEEEEKRDYAAWVSVIFMATFGLGMFFAKMCANCKKAVEGGNDETAGDMLDNPNATQQANNMAGGGQGQTP